MKKDDVSQGADDTKKKKLSFKEKMLSTLISTKNFIFDNKHKTIFGQTSDNWLKLSIYYFFFYIALGLFFSGMVAIFAAILSRERPRYEYTHSALTDSGKCYIGMAFRPMPDITDNSLIVSNDKSNQLQLIASLRAYKNAFLNQTDPTSVQECTPYSPASALPVSKSCKFSWSDIVTPGHPCSESTGFGWLTGKPCILIKLNKIYAWMPKSSADTISNVENAIGVNVTLKEDPNTQNIYITCNGLYPADQDVIGPLTYYSILFPLGNPYYGGMPFYYYPYLNTPQHVEPFVLVQFTNLPSYRLVNVVCRGWAANIYQELLGTKSRGMTSFNLYKENITQA